MSAPSAGLYAEAMSIIEESFRGPAGLVRRMMGSDAE